MFEHFNTPEEIFSFKLGAALTMERETLTMLGELEAAAQRPELKAMFREHAGETVQQINNIEKSFQLLGEDVDTSPCPAIEGLSKEGKASIRKSDPSVVDAVILAGALETEYHEIAVYETLVTNAEARGAADVAELLKANLAQEEGARDKVRAAAKEISTTGIAVDPTTT